MASILRIANLCKTYKITNTQKQEVLKGVNLELNDGELVCLLGESGCGKSTLINIIGGLDTDYTGSVVIKGSFIRDFTEQEMNDYRKKRIGLIFQNYNLINTMTLLENVEIAMQMSDVEKEVRIKRALDLLDMVGLKSHANKFPNQLSGGQKQRVAIARSLANNPSIILADEPTGALDKEASAQVLTILKKIAEMGKLVIIVTHSNTVANECSRIVKMDDGIIVEDNLITKPAKNQYDKYKEVELKNIKTIDIGKISARNLWYKKSRSLLVSLGISIGIAALILILALSRGITNYVKEYYAADVTSTLIEVIDEEDVFSSAEIEKIRKLDGTKTITQSHVANNVSYVLEDKTGSIKNMYENISTNKPSIIYGDEISSATDVVVDMDFAKTITLNGVVEVIGKTISLTYNSKTYEYKIVGIFDNEDTNSVYISSSALSNYFTDGKTINILYVNAKDVTYLESLDSEISNLGFETTIKDDTSSVILDYIDLGTKVLTAVAAISTVVSAIMIIIVLYISVIERTEEIGILRSIGARKIDILKMFMVEAGILGLLGGTFGVGFAYLIAGITNLVSEISSGFSFISLNPLYYLIGLFISFFVSVLAGIAPAKKASDLDPVEALRFE